MAGRGKKGTEAFMNPDYNEIYRRAIEVGCTPLWWDGMCGWAWHCNCPEVDGYPPHACDQQCSMLTMKSLAKGK